MVSIPYTSLVHVSLLLNLLCLYLLERLNNGIRVDGGPCIESFSGRSFRQVCLVRLNDVQIKVIIKVLMIRNAYAVRDCTNVKGTHT